MYRLAMACGPVEKAADAGTKAVDTLTQTSIGALLVLLALACGLLGWLVIKAKNAHLADKDAMREELLKHAIQSRELAAENARAYEQFAEAARRGEARSEDVLSEIESVSDQAKATKKVTERSSEKIDALAVSIPGVDHNKYLLATKGGK